TAPVSIPNGGDCILSTRHRGGLNAENNDLYKRGNGFALCHRERSAEAQCRPGDECCGRVARAPTGEACGALQERSRLLRALRPGAREQDLNIDFTTAQLNDVLNSLTVVDLGGGRIGGVRFNSIAPLSERLKALRLPLSEGTSRNDFLNALRGTRVEVHNGAASGAGR